MNGKPNRAVKIPKHTSCYIVASCKDWHHAEFICLEEGVEGHWLWVTKPEELNDAVSNTAPRYIFFLHWNWYVPASIHKTYECVCFHMTDVPYGRGGSPLQNLILNGHAETQLTALKMIDEMDAGPVYTKRPLSLEGKAQTIYEEAGRLSFDIIRWMIDENPEPKEQIGKATYFKRRNPEQSRLPLACNLNELYDFIRMLDADGYPLAFIEYGNKILKLTDAVLKNGELTAQVTFRPKDVE